MRDCVLCPACSLDDDVRSVVRVRAYGYSDEPVDEFWDEDGDFHVHALSQDFYLFECSRGHVWEESEPQTLCWCEDEYVPSWRDREAIHDAAD